MKEEGKEMTRMKKITGKKRTRINPLQRKKRMKRRKNKKKEKKRKKRSQKKSTLQLKEKTLRLLSYQILSKKLENINIIPSTLEGEVCLEKLQSLHKILTKAKRA